MAARLILAINPGSGSTKYGLYQEEKELRAATIRHSDADLARFAGRAIAEQAPWRFSMLEADLARGKISLAELAAVVGRGGLLSPLLSGTYRVTPAMLEELCRAPRGEHASNLGAMLAAEAASRAACPAFIVDPVSVDEWQPVARLSGLAGLERESLSHALNSKAVARRYARQQGRRYSELRLVVAHLGSGISVSAHRNGRMVDATNSREEGAFSSDRAGGVPVMKLVERCFRPGATRAQVERELFGEGGVYSYLGTRDLSEAMRQMEQGSNTARLVLDALTYQIAKEIGAMATVLAGKVDAVLITGGMAHSPALVERLLPRIAWIAPLRIFPGEDELAALAAGALRVLNGEEPAHDYPPERSEAAAD